jgi:hypothetical protein
MSSWSFRILQIRYETELARFSDKRGMSHTIVVILDMVVNG